MSPEDNKILSRRLLEDLWNAKNLALQDEVLTTDFIEHIGGASLHTEEIKQMISANLAAFPDIQATVEDQLAEEDKVVTRWKVRGTHRRTDGYPGFGQSDYGNGDRD
jgi:predicted ester cyclase